ncbi:type-F conjugative transfer system secretin TraK [bacterium AH-315-F18]|nr:type-F conjugative transfer system secretin TraK [bacterium AH-315-F18]
MIFNLNPIYVAVTYFMLLGSSLPGAFAGGSDDHVASPKKLTREVIWNGSRSIHLRVPVATTKQMLTTAVIFPEEALADVIAGWDPNHISLERAYGQIFLRLLDRDHRGHLDVLGKSGRLYRLFLEPATDGAHDETVRIVLAKDKARERLKQTQGFSALDLIRAMKLGRIPEGVDVQDAKPSKKCRYPRLVEDGRTRLCLVRTYTTPEYTGHVLQLVNLQRTPYNLDITRFKAPALMLIATDRSYLPPAQDDDRWGHTTFIYIVRHR